ncbi:MAG: sugar ABC transporter ATP-binding protein [Gordonia sp.]|nr:sugar ABC transporter ATP-binding protein [Gordonia sp. (in: high G+C Gram-positive bacteria)]
MELNKLDTQPVAAQPDAAPLALSAQSVSKTFAGTTVLSKVDLDVRVGEVHALVGQNGSGKSTLIKILSGFHEPDPGSSATALGRELELGSRNMAAELGVRFVHQDLGLVPALTSVENFALGIGYPTTRIHRIKWRQHRTMVRDAVRSLGHDFDLDLPVERLTPVERTALAIARALHNPDNLSVLVLDEPTATMPRRDVDRLHALVRRVRDNGVGILYVSHHLDEVFALADRVTVLRDGSKIVTTTTSDLDEATLVQAMTGTTLDSRDRPAVERKETDVVLSVAGLACDELSDLSLDVRAGEILGIAGVTGSGREQVCDAIFGRLNRHGRVHVLGRELPAGAPAASVKAGMAFVPANRLTQGAILTMSARENLSLGDLASISKFGVLRRSKEFATCSQWISKLAVKTPGIDTMLASLSGGNQQKVIIGRCLRRDPKVLLLNEPTQGVDIAAKFDLHRLIDEAAEAGSAVIVASSDEEELERLCDRVIVMRDGVRAIELAREEITTSILAVESLGPKP